MEKITFATMEKGKLNLIEDYLIVKGIRTKRTYNEKEYTYYLDFEIDLKGFHNLMNYAHKIAQYHYGRFIFND